MNTVSIHEYLCACRELTRLCRQNGWIDNETLKMDVIEQDEKSLLAAVTFEEIIVEAAGCIGGRIPCHGRVRIALAEDGNVKGVEIL
uniref:Uncharacterized protein n=1 Tax=Candidatus Kentrum eta TaxID=2126337 RepID=A0A450U5E8_9GAMM|nr:MAG: hypothetical protein BECKH772A_GA0070896_1000148 [Candidatus Kentron sp. H]VFJ88273.1 MAG: hypothetical protein BECKH772B_GA0070898_1000140 [Candidatus Kentron sp. H]VFJ95495.1 MAG: hypothetical protein BECKH772C_GA0070978_1000248 [Candidatus Kentron sp. H]